MNDTCIQVPPCTGHFEVVHLYTHPLWDDHMSSFSRTYGQSPAFYPAPPTIIKTSVTTFPSSQPEPAGGSLPFYPGAPSSPQWARLRPEAEWTPVCLGAAAPPEAPTPEQHERQPQEQKDQEAVPPRPLTSEKFPMPHVCARFSPGGHLIKVVPNLPSEGQPALVELKSMEMIFQKSLEKEEMRAFPGPLTKEDTHKADVIRFAQKKTARCSQANTLVDKDSAQLLWDFVVLLCKQNGTVVGTDIAELLLQDRKTVAWLPRKSETAEQGEEESSEVQLSFFTGSHLSLERSLKKEMERFRDLLLNGRKKHALELAMKQGLWGHALLLASKMDSRTYAKVMTKFAISLPRNDPLQTVYQLLSGRMPTASTSCGDEKWGDWRPHLAMILSNMTNNWEVALQSINTMGDTLASKGLLDAAHFCYLVVQVAFGVCTKKSSKLVLIGSDPSLPFCKFATNEAIQRTEAYEYVQSLGTQPCVLPDFQAFKFIYACRLAEMGLTAQALHYCEVISRAVLRNPCRFSPVLLSQLIEKSWQFRLSDPLLKENPELELLIEPEWLVQLRNLDGQIKEGTVAYSPDRSTPQQYNCSTPNSELELTGPNKVTEAGQEGNWGTDNLLLAPLLPLQSVRLMPSAPPTILNSSTAPLPPSQPESAGGAVPCWWRCAPSSPQWPRVGPGFSTPPEAEQSSVCLGTAAPPEGPTPEPHELQPQQQKDLEAVLARDVSHDSPDRKTAPEAREEDFHGKVASTGYGQRSRTTSESSVRFRAGHERQTAKAKQPSSPPSSIPDGEETKNIVKRKLMPQKSPGSWFEWLRWRGKKEVHLPDDTHKSIIWDEKKQQWINLDEPEEEIKPPPPPPMGFPQVVQAGAESSASSAAPVNRYSRKTAWNATCYVDVLVPSGSQPEGAAPVLAPMAPMPIPANLLVPNPATEMQQPLEVRVAEDQRASGNQPILEMATQRPAPVATPGSTRLGRLGLRK